MPSTPPSHFRNAVCLLIVALITKAARPKLEGPGGAQNVTGSKTWVSIKFGQIVTYFVSSRDVVSLPAVFIQRRQVEGRYLPGSVLAVHVQLMLPPATVMGESKR